jgi:hypothetical protein
MFSLTREISYINTNNNEQGFRVNKQNPMRLSRTVHFPNIFIGHSNGRRDEIIKKLHSCLSCAL